MNRTLTVSKASLIALLDGLYDDPYDPIDPDSPIGPIIRWSWVALNPQPLPPVASPVPDPWRLAGAFSQPWRAALLARTSIDRLIAAAQFAEIAAGAAEAGQDAIRKRIAQLVDDFCGNRPPRWPFPWPWPPKPDADHLGPVELVVIGAQFQKAADAMVDNPLHADFSAAADQLLETGLERMESGRNR
jgi:hypothetical protein